MTAADRAARRHRREQATIDRLVKGVRKPVIPENDSASSDPMTSTGLPVEDQVRKEWGPDKGGLPTFLRRDPRQLSSRKG